MHTNTLALHPISPTFIIFFFSKSIFFAGPAHRMFANGAADVSAVSTGAVGDSIMSPARPRQLHMH